MVTRKNEEVSASFHYLARMKKSGNEEAISPFTTAEFSALFAKMQAQKPFDLKQESDIERLRSRKEAPLENLDFPNARTITGTFRASYYGHGYDNTDKGKISAQSVNLRPFHFVLYLSETGMIYIGSQYLGLFGGYNTLKDTLVGFMPERKGIRSHSFRLGASYYKNAEPREIRVNVANKSTAINGRSTLGGKIMIALTRSGKDDILVERVKRNIIPFFGQGQNAIKHAVAGLMNQSDVIAIEDDDVIDCTVLADMNGKSTTIYMFENGFRATRFPLEVDVDEDGHPGNADTCNEILIALNDHVIKVTENG
ncbi:MULTISPECIES: hypothetical protein [unclassified Ensifer]|uniref:hypothetical protein n=1 Tax=unclassified Ensifer TaxID=2633371 RepID=UPI000812F2D9|nr:MULTISPECIES: hypothetical protein [unclassified Ensifer]OCP17036.1 hypothetical protein BC360_12425 [Ensifer sp. LC163]OCP24135.1 hypothetical protein BC363_23150 [Ensifer sp. LC384]OCP25632.1 hypothetical protein BC361_17545 [Ensifer sp. LC54]